MDEDGEMTGEGREGGAGGAAPSSRRRIKIVGEPKAVGDAYDAAGWLLNCTAKYPREYRFSLGERTQGAILDVLEGLVSAAYETDKARDLESANRALQRARILVRLGRDLKAVTERQYEFVVPKMVEIGKQIGGWLKQKKGATRP
jgi:hypothetical protein